MSDTHPVAGMALRTQEGAWDAGLHGEVDGAQLDVGLAIDGAPGSPQRVGVWIETQRLGRLAVALEVPATGSAQVSSLAHAREADGPLQPAVGLDAQSGVPRLEAEVSRLKLALAQSQREAADAVAEAVVARDEARGRAAALAEGKARAETATRDDAAKYSTDLDEARAQLEGLRGDLSRAAQGDPALISRAEQAEASLGAARKELEDLNAQIRELRTQLSRRGEAQEAVETRAHQAEAESGAIKNALDGARRERDTAKAELEEAKQQLQASKATFEEARQRHDSASAELEDTRMALDASKAALEEARQQHDTARAELKVAGKALDASKAEFKDAASARRELDKAQNELEKARAELKELRPARSELERSRAELTGLKLLRKELEQARADAAPVPELRAKVEALGAELAAESEARVEEAAARAAASDEAARATAEARQKRLELERLSKEVQRAEGRPDAALAAEAQRAATLLKERDEARNVARELKRSAAKLLSERDEARALARALHDRGAGASAATTSGELEALLEAERRIAAGLQEEKQVLETRLLAAQRQIQRQHSLGGAAHRPTEPELPALHGSDDDELTKP